MTFLGTCTVNSSDEFLISLYPAEKTFFLLKNLGPDNTLGEQVQLGHFHRSKTDLIQNQVTISHMKPISMICFVCLFHKIKDPNKIAFIS